MNIKKLIESLETRRLLSDGHDHDGLIPLPNDYLFPGRAGGDYQLGPRWTSTASGSTGSSGNPITLTWGLVSDGVSIPGSQGEPTSGSNLIARLNTKYGSQAAWLPLFQSVFDRWSEVSGITYIYEPNDDGASFSSSSGVLGVRADLRIGGHNIDGGFNILAYNFFPGSGNGGNMVIDTSEFLAGGAFASTANNSRAFRNMLSHEHGHGMGLYHVEPVNTTKLMEPFLATNFDGPQFDDILGAQAQYGDSFEKGGRNETALTASNLGTLSPGDNQTLVQQVSIANSADNDYFKFTVVGGTSISFTLTPEGTTYQQGPQGGTATSFNPAAAANLNFALYDTNGTTALLAGNTNAAGVAESITTGTLPEGTYYLRILMSGTGTTQMYKVSANVVIGAAPPSTPDLAASSDLGTSQTDNLTSDNTPTLTGSSAANTQIYLFDDGVDVGSTTSNASGTWTITLPVLADGVHSLTARSFDGSTFSSPSAPLVITIDTVAPALPSWTYDRDLTQDVRLTFSEPLAAQVTAAKLTLTNTTTASTVSIASVIYSGGNTVATVSFTPVMLANGRFVLSMAASGLTDVAGNPLAANLSIEFVQLAGDANGDGVVGFPDLLIVAQNYNLNQKTFSQGNFNYDASGIVDFSDLLIVAQNYGTSVLQAITQVTPVTPAAAQSKRKTNNQDILA